MMQKYLASKIKEYLASCNDEQKVYLVREYVFKELTLLQLRTLLGVLQHEIEVRA